MSHFLRSAEQLMIPKKFNYSLKLKRSHWKIFCELFYFLNSIKITTTLQVFCTWINLSYQSCARAFIQKYPFQCKDIFISNLSKKKKKRSLALQRIFSGVFISSATFTSVLPSWPWSFTHKYTEYEFIKYFGKICFFV